LFGDDDLRLTNDAGAFHDRRQFRRFQESFRVGRGVPLEHQAKIVLVTGGVCDPKAALAARVTLRLKPSNECFQSV